jgi:hypothetical protein
MNPLCTRRAFVADTGLEAAELPVDCGRQRTRVDRATHGRHRVLGLAFGLLPASASLSVQAAGGMPAPPVFERYDANGVGGVSMVDARDRRIDASFDG